jgi:hypothetical protein
LAPYRCRSWRHAGDCARWRASQDFARISAALEARGPEWVFIVLTGPGGPLRSIPHGYALLKNGWPKLRKRLTYSYGAIRFISLIEEHRDGVPHMNLLIHCPRLHRYASAPTWKPNPKRGAFYRHVVAAGFGRQMWIEPARGDRTAGYLVKLAKEAAGANAKGQSPWHAGRHFRRLRSSRGLLPKCFKNPDITGKLVLAPMPTPVPTGVSREGAAVSPARARRCLPRDGVISVANFRGHGTTVSAHISGGAYENCRSVEPKGGRR